MSRGISECETGVQGVGLRVQGLEFRGLEGSGIRLGGLGLRAGGFSASWGLLWVTVMKTVLPLGGGVRTSIHIYIYSRPED